MRYVRLWLALARYTLIRELTFRTNFLIKVVVEVLWLGILLVFYNVAVFARTDYVGTDPDLRWTQSEYMFYVGCYFTLSSVLEALFLENCGKFADLVRSGDLDFYLLKPVDEQFLVSCRQPDWSAIPSIVMGIGVMLYALDQGGWQVQWLNVVCFLLVFVCGVAIGYSFLLMLTASSVWLVRNRSLYELWWLFSSLMRYPRSIFQNTWAAPLAWVFTFVLPVLLAINIPAEVMVKAVEPAMVFWSVVSALILVLLSRLVLRSAMRHYRSASS